MQLWKKKTTGAQQAQHLSEPRLEQSTSILPHASKMASFGVIFSGDCWFWSLHGCTKGQMPCNFQRIGWFKPSNIFWNFRPHDLPKLTLTQVCVYRNEGGGIHVSMRGCISPLLIWNVKTVWLKIEDYSATTKNNIRLPLPHAAMQGTRQAEMRQTKLEIRKCCQNEKYPDWNKVTKRKVVNTGSKVKIPKVKMSCNCT